MLSYIRGTIEDKTTDAVVLDNNGMGIRIYTSGLELENLPELHREVRMYVHMYVKEDDLRLFGFSTKEGLALFEMLIGVSGVGPKAALAILSTLTVSEAYVAIANEDTAALTQAKGIGANTAKHIVLDLKKKVQDETLAQFVQQGENTDKAKNNSVIQETALALVGLGYSNQEAMRALSGIDHASEMTEEQLLKQALRALL